MGAFISLLYYLGAMNWIILKLAWLMSISLQTSPPESMVAAGKTKLGIFDLIEIMTACIRSFDLDESKTA